MRKILINSVLFVPIVVFGCFNGNFSRQNEQIALVKQLEKIQLEPRSISILNRYGHTIQHFSTLYGVDWRLVVAVMKAESQFDDEAESQKGAIGLMQIMPATQALISKETGMDSLAFDDPPGNIKGGIYYLAKIYHQFDDMNISEENRVKLTLASYNAGLGRVLDARTMARYVNDDPNEWKSVKNSLSLLSRKYSSLHRYVWEERRPTSGYFKDWQQTSNYVESVVGFYQEYKVIFKNKV
jgi:membrane-bound lytic murein transglycosylase F